MGLALAGCRGPGVAEREARGPAPAWLRRPSDGPAGRLVAVGSGPTRPSAIDAAVARLAQSIRVRVSADETARVSGATLDRPGGARLAAADSRFDGAVRLTSDVSLPGVRVEEVWREGAAGVFHARVSLDRAEGASRLGWAFDRALAEARAALDDAGDDALASLARARQAARAIARAHDALDTRLALAGADPGRTEALRQAERRAARALAEARAGATIAVWPADGRSDALARQVETRLIEAGATLDPRAPAVVVRVRWRRAPAVAFRPDLRLDRWDAAVEVIDARSRSALARWEGSGVSREPTPTNLPDLNAWLDALVGR